MTATHPNPAAAVRASVRPITLVERVSTEFRKLTNHRGGRIFTWVAAGLLVLFAFVPTVALWADMRTVVGSATMAVIPLVYVIGIFALLVGAEEWRQKTVMVTYVQDSNRTGVFVAKAIAAVLIGFVLVIAALLLGALFGLLFGGSTDRIGEFMGTVAAPFLGVVVTVMVGMGLSGATLSVTIGLILFLVAMPLLPQIMSIFSPTQEIAPYLDMFGGLNALYGVAWPNDWAQFLVATIVWAVIPFGIAIWRNASKDIS